MPHDVRPFGVILDELCRAGGPGRGSFSNVEVAKAVEQLGGKVSHAYVAQMRRGQRDNPTLRLIQDLARVFDCHPAYFVGGRRQPDSPRRALRLSERLDFLFSNVHALPGAAFTYESVALAVRDRGVSRNDAAQWTINAATLSNLRRGADTNLTLKQLLGVAEVFQVHPAYFLDDLLAARMEEQIAHAKQLHQLGITEVAARAQSSGPWGPDARQQLVRALVAALSPIGLTAEEARGAFDDSAGTDGAEEASP